MRYNVVSAQTIAVLDRKTKGGSADGVCSDPDAAKTTLKKVCHLYQFKIRSTQRTYLPIFHQNRTVLCQCYTGVLCMQTEVTCNLNKTTVERFD